MIKSKIISVVFAFLLVCGFATNGVTQPTDYIERYSKIAVREMHRSGIPASITLAQGILESSWGKGALALKANNHFGIKCKRSWTGATFYIKDDDYKRGKLIKSCFRSYDNAEDSYLDHTDFLLTNARYQKLFSYGHTNYKKWAHGLKKAGYATDKRYAYKLISTIKKYNLNRFDNVPEAPSLAVVTSENAPPLEVAIAIEQPQKIKRKKLRAIRSKAPKVFVLPSDYKRGDGLSMASKGNKIQEQTASVLWNKK